jgi:predicted XRE-type DNA-binding protein
MDRKEKEARRIAAEKALRRVVIKNLRMVLQDKSVTQTELSRLLEVAHSGVSDWFVKGALPSVETLVKMFRLPLFRHVSLEWLLTGEGSMLRTGNIPGEQAHYLGGVAALGEAAREIEHMKQLWVSQVSVKERDAAQQAVEAAQAARRDDAAPRRDSKKGGRRS